MHFKRKPKASDWLNITVIVGLIALFAWIGLSYTQVFGKLDWRDLPGSAENMRQFMLSFGNVSLLIIVFLHALHVIISFIPSVMVEFVGGMIFGVPVGLITANIGIAIGTAVSFYLSRLLGRRVVTLFVSEKNMVKMEKLVSNKTSTLMLLILFILPTPKDFFAYFVGLTNMKASTFFLISFVGRLPAMIVATYLGSRVYDGNYVAVIAIIIVSSGGCLLFYLLKDKISAKFNKKNA